MKPGLGFEGKVDEVWRNALQSALQLTLEARGEAGVVSGLHQAGRTLELQCVKPAVVARRPSLDPRRGLDRLSEQEFAQPVLGPAEIILGVKPDPHQVAQSFVLRTWNPNRREVSRA